MKRIVILAAFLIFAFAFPNEISAKSINSIDGGVYFYSSLSPYGNWIQIDAGVTAWQPGRMSPGWAPYTEGYWEWTNDGWYWVSNEPFGYITYHYGRWYNDDYYGWIWVPDNQWAPAWVEWRYDDDYIGWAPLPPYAGFSITVGINFSRNYITPYSQWHFISYRYMCDPYGYNYYVPSRDIYRIYSRTKYRTNYGYSNGRVINRGVNIDFVRTRGGRDIRERTIERVNDPDQIRNNDARNSDRIRTYYPGSENISRENVDERKIERSGRRSSLESDKVIIGRERETGRNMTGQDGISRDPGSIRNDGQIREQNRVIERRTEQNNPNIIRDRNIEKKNGADRSVIERNRIPDRPRNEAPRIINNRVRERPQVRTESKSNRESVRKQDDKGTKRKR